MTDTEHRIIRFVERDLSDAEQKALMEECAASGDARGLFAQHIALDKHLAASLAAMQPTPGAIRGLEERLMTERTSVRAPRSVPRGVLAGASILTVLLFAALAYVAAPTPASVPIAPVPSPGQAVPSGAAPVATSSPVVVSAPAPTHTPMHRHPRPQSDVAPIAPSAVAAKSVQSPAAQPTQVAQRQRTVIRLTEKDEVK